MKCSWEKALKGPFQLIRAQFLKEKQCSVVGHTILLTVGNLKDICKSE